VAIPVGGVAGVEFVRPAYPPQARMGNDVVEEFQLIVTGNTEDISHAEFGQTIKEIVAHGVASFGDGVHHSTVVQPTPGVRLRTCPLP
jgi:hypothetical protein